jgi:D-aminoacyl-tRNA deacylase
MVRAISGIYYRDTAKHLILKANMKAVLQRVTRASVTVEGQVTGRIGAGLLVLLGVGPSDTREEAVYLLDKIAGLRVFEDQAGKMNLSVTEIGGGLLVVSQFTLFAETRRGRRPSFAHAGPPELARELYEYFVAEARARGIFVQAGIFQAHMEVELLNSGPVTILCESPIEWKEVRPVDPGSGTGV